MKKDLTVEEKAQIAVALRDRINSARENVLRSDGDIREYFEGVVASCRSALVKVYA